MSGKSLRKASGQRQEASRNLNAHSTMKELHVTQHPLVNVFKHCEVGKWKKCSKAGKVSSHMDETVKCTVYRIAGSVPAANYIQLPATRSQSLALTGRYLYVLFRPIASRFFVMHIDLVVADEQIAVRVTLGNVFRCLKATRTWLQLPVSGCVGSAGTGSHTAESASTRWTLMCLDCQDTLRVYHNRQYSHVKSIRLCANMLVKNVFTSDFDYDPLASRSSGRGQAKWRSGERMPLPREMAFYLLPGDDWTSHYSYVRLPASQNEISRVSSGTDVPPSSIEPPPRIQADERSNLVGWSSLADVKVFADDGARPQITVHHSAEEPAEEQYDSENLHPMPLKILEPDPLLLLRKVVGFGGGTSKEVIWSKDGCQLFYPCHGVIVSVDVASRKQSHLVGHSDKVSCMATNGPTSLLATGQRGTMPAIRLWDLSTGRCCAVFKVHDHGLHSLALSYTGGVLCGVGRDSHNRQMVVVWNTSNAMEQKGGDVHIVAKTLTDFDISRMRVADFDDTRMVSCGRENIRLWRVRSGELRSAPVNLGPYHGVVVNDVTFEGVSGKCMDDPCQQRIFACTSNGMILQVNYKQLRVDRAFQISSPGSKPLSAFSGNDQPRGILSICVNAAFAATGSDDGFLRLWPLDFSRVFLEAEHEASVSSVAISADGLKVSCGTSGGQLGVVDVTARSYSTVTRSHAADIVSASVNSQHKQLATASHDGTVCIWDLNSLEQLYTFLAPMDRPSIVTFHPRLQCVAVGYASGYVRLFHSRSTSVITEHRCQSAAINGLLFVPSGRRLVSSSQDDSLVLFDSELQVLKPLRTLGNTIAKPSLRIPRSVDALSLSDDGRTLAFIGPTPHIVTVAEALTLNEMLHVDISSVSHSSDHSLDAAVSVRYTPSVLSQLLVYTLHGKLLCLAAANGQILSKVENINEGPCSALAVSNNGRLLFSAGDRQLRVWDYQMRLDINYQSYIGHSSDVQQLVVTAGDRQVLSLGDSVFVWDCQGMQQHQPALPDDTSVSAGKSQYNQLISPEHPRQPPAPRPPPMPVSSLHELDTTFVGTAEEDVDQQRPAERPGVAVDSTSSSPVSISRSISDESACASDHSVSTAYKSTESDEEDGMPERIEILQAREPEQKSVPCPSVVKHYTGCTEDLPPMSEKPFLAAKSDEILRLESVIGFNGKGRGNLLWYSAQGLVMYSVGPMVVVEDLASGQQRHFIGHASEISSMCLRHDKQMIASVSGAKGMENSQLCLWDLNTDHCIKVLTVHEKNIIAIKYSPDDAMLVTLGCYQDPLLVIWETKTMTRLTSAKLEQPAHDVSWDQFRAGELLTVGERGSVSFWMLEKVSEGTEEGDSYSLKVHATSLPEEASHAPHGKQCHVTCCAYINSQMLIVGTSTGLLAAWSTNTNSCSAHWKAEDSELTYLIAGGSRIITTSASGFLKKWTISGLDVLMSPSAQMGLESCDVGIEAELTVDSAIVSAEFNTDLQLGLVATQACNVWCINWKDLTTSRLLCGHSDQISSLCTWPAIKPFLATSSHDGSLRLWLTDCKEQVSNLDTEDEVACTCAAVCRLGSEDSFAPTEVKHAGREAGSPHYVGAEELPSVQDHSRHEPTLLYNALVSSDTEASPAKITSTKGISSLSVHKSSVGHRLCVTGYADGCLRLFDLEHQHMLLKTKPHSASVTSVGISTDGAVLLSGDITGQLIVSNAVTGMTVRRLTQHNQAPITDVQVAPADLLLTSGSGKQGQQSDLLEGLWLAASVDGRISIWCSDWKGDRCDLVDWLTFPAPSDRRFAKRWPLRHDDQSASSSLPPTMARFVMTGGGQVIYTGFSLQKAVDIYSLCTRQVVRRVTLAYWASDLAISQHGLLCFVASREGVIRCINLDAGSFQDILTGGKNIPCLRSLPGCSKTGRGERLVVAMSNAVQVWKVIQE